MLLATTATKNDPMVAALFLMMLAVGLDLAVRPGAEPARNRAGQVVLLACAWLLALGTKPYILHLTPGLVAAWALAYHRCGTEGALERAPGGHRRRGCVRIHPDSAWLPDGC